jgi:hypothetical protein
MVNGNGVGYNFVTYQGVEDLCTLTLEQVQTTILDQTLQDDPYNLQLANFNLTTARTDGMALRSKIKGKILRLTFATVCNTLFLKLCPGYSNQPHAVLDHIRQVHIVREGNQKLSATSKCTSNN